MPKATKIKVVIRPSDYNRVVVTDTSPFEVPVIFSNDGFYKNLTNIKGRPAHFSVVLEKILKTGRFTIPYRYRIVKNPTAARQLSLLHPSAQVDVCDFYSKYENLICYYSMISEFSMRSPERVGSAYHFKSKLSDKNRFKNSTVDLVGIDKLVRNPATYFAYRGVDLLYKFFNSSEFLRLERKYCFMLSLDIAKCFDSIYTHSIAWALKDIETAKNHIDSGHFGSQFDAIMQRMNYNETNGICIGPEVSRIFSEIILGKVDVNFERELRKKNLKHRRDYQVRRYVDNYYIFANSEADCRKVHAAIAKSLLDYKLHINEGKTEIQSRPFYTKKSKLTDEINNVIMGFFDKIIQYDYQEDRKFSYPINIRRYDALLQSVIREIKSKIFATDANYGDVTNYIISAVSKRIISLMEDADLGSIKKTCAEEDYVQVSMLLLELSFFLYTTNPTVASSLSLSKSIIISARLVSEKYPLKLPLLQERIARWTAQLMRDPRLMEITKNSDAISIEILNILIAMHDIAADHAFNEEIFRQIFGDITDLNYFSLISCLFIIRDNAALTALKSDIFSQVCKVIDSSPTVIVSSHSAHLFLDIISCPFLNVNDRIKLYKIVAKSLDLNSVANADAEAAVSYCEKNPWFVSWSGVELYSLIEKKRLSAVY